MTDEDRQHANAATGSPDWLLANLIDAVPHARSAVLLAADGVPTASHGLSPALADQVAAVSSGLFSLSHTAAVRLGGGGSARRVVAELEDFLMFVSEGGSGSVLAVLAGREVDAGVLGHEMELLVKSVRPFLATQPRRGGAVTPLPEPGLPQRLPPAAPS
jgi:predicted regulator of Ras-like GTPase activity (Roadblock/LC7/MglB family)